MIHRLVSELTCRSNKLLIFNTSVDVEGEVGYIYPSNRFKPPSYFKLLTVQRRYFCRGSLCCLYWCQFCAVFTLICPNDIKSGLSYWVTIFRKELHTRLTVCSPCNMSHFNFGCFHFCFDGRAFGLIAPVSGHCLHLT